MTHRERRQMIARVFGDNVKDFTPARLQELADGPLHDPRQIYLPAGRLTIEETRAREARILRGRSS
jgi:hypothetical protein